MDCPLQNVSQMLNGWPHTECFTKYTKWMAHTECFSLHNKWMAPYRMFYHTYYMDGPIQNDFPHILNEWHHTECFTNHTKWMAPYRMFLPT